MFDIAISEVIHTKNEITKWWDKLCLEDSDESALAKIKHFKFNTDKENCYIILYYTDNVYEALTVALLFIRHLSINITNTYYEKTSKLLYINYSISPLDKEYTPVAIKRIIKFIRSNRYKILCLDYDMLGQPLFAKEF